MSSSRTSILTTPCFRTPGRVSRCSSRVRRGRIASAHRRRRQPAGANRRASLLARGDRRRPSRRPRRNDHEPGRDVSATGCLGDRRIRRKLAHDRGGSRLLASVGRGRPSREPPGGADSLSHSRPEREHWRHEPRPPPRGDDGDPASRICSARDHRSTTGQAEGSTGAALGAMVRSRIATLLLRRSSRRWVGGNGRCGAAARRCGDARSAQYRLARTTALGVARYASFVTPGVIPSEVDGSVPAVRRRSCRPAVRGCVASVPRRRNRRHAP